MAKINKDRIESSDQDGFIQDRINKLFFASALKQLQQK